jgi:hypothetical protein
MSALVSIASAARRLGFADQRVEQRMRVSARRTGLRQVTRLARFGEDAQAPRP